MPLTAALTPADAGGCVAFNPETGTTTQGETVEAAVVNLRDATALYLSEFPMALHGHPVVTTFSVPEHASAASGLGCRGSEGVATTRVREGAPQRKLRRRTQRIEGLRRTDARRA
jgi:predicted RNase H-like HicB family nuclease